MRWHTQRNRPWGKSRKLQISASQASLASNYAAAGNGSSFWPEVKEAEFESPSTPSSSHCPWYSLQKSQEHSGLCWSCSHHPGNNLSSFSPSDSPGFVLVWLSVVATLGSSSSDEESTSPKIKVRFFKMRGISSTWIGWLRFKPRDMAIVNSYNDLFAKGKMCKIKISHNCRVTDCLYHPCWVRAWTHHVFYTTLHAAGLNQRNTNSQLCHGKMKNAVNEAMQWIIWRSLHTMSL